MAIPNPTKSNCPIPLNKLRELAAEACEDVLPNDEYDHTQTEGWNTAIIQKVLKTATEATADSYKWIVNATLFQHGTEDSVGRPMHSSVGAFWDSEFDGNWSFKFGGKAKSDFDVLVTVTWIKI